MASEIYTSLIAGIFVLLNTIVSVVTIHVTKRIQRSVDRKSDSLRKSFEETSKFRFIEGERASFDELTRVTLNEPNRIRVTRFNPQKIQKKERYSQAFTSRILGTEFEGENYGKLERYNRLTSFNSQENKDSILQQIDFFLEKGATNLILRITADKNDFEVILADSKKTAFFCFHDLGQQEVLHSCLITTDYDLFIKFSELYEKLWNQDILLEIDFSLGRDHVIAMREKILHLTPVKKESNLAPFDNIVNEARIKIENCKIINERC
jgi:hypothetical protein